jgi:hypothetical protein
MASMIKIITSHFAMVIENPAIAFAPSTYATSAKMRNNTANPIKSATIHLLWVFIRSGLSILYTIALWIL